MVSIPVSTSPNKCKILLFLGVMQHMHMQIWFFIYRLLA